MQTYYIKLECENNGGIEPRVCFAHSVGVHSALAEPYGCHDMRMPWYILVNIDTTVTKISYLQTDHMMQINQSN